MAVDVSTYFDDLQNGALGNATPYVCVGTYIQLNIIIAVQKRQFNAAINVGRYFIFV